MKVPFGALSGLVCVLGFALVSNSEAVPLPDLFVPSLDAESFQRCLKGEIDFSLRKQFPDFVKTQNPFGSCFAQATVSAIEAALYRASGERPVLSAEFALCTAAKQNTESFHEKRVQELKKGTVCSYVDGICTSADFFQRVVAHPEAALVENNPTLQSHLKNLFGWLDHYAKAGELETKPQMCEKVDGAIQQCKDSGMVKAHPELVEGLQSSPILGGTKNPMRYVWYVTISKLLPFVSAWRDLRVSMPAQALAEIESDRSSQRFQYRVQNQQKKLLERGNPALKEKFDRLWKSFEAVLEQGPHAEGLIFGKPLKESFADVTQMYAELAREKTNCDEIRTKVLNYLCRGLPVLASLPITGLEASSRDGDYALNMSTDMSPNMHEMVMTGVQTDPATHRRYFTFLNSFGPLRERVRMPITESCRFMELDVVTGASDRLRIQTAASEAKN